MTNNRYLGFKQHSATEWLKRMQSSPYAEAKIDNYSEGELVSQLENQIADILNKPAALFFNKGMTAQFAMLKVIEERSKNSRFIMSPYCHLAIDEETAFKHLLKMQAVYPTHSPRPYNREDLSTVENSVGSMMVELPLRRAGFRLPTWQELVDLSDWAHSNHVHFHMDGARLWESRHFYDKSEAEIASLFDSVYVSLYKGLGGMGGALLAGDKDFIEECKVWRSRMAGDHYSLFPFVITGLEGLDRHYEGMEELVNRSIKLARKLNEIEGLTVPKPHTNGFIIHLEDDVTGTEEALTKKITALNKKRELIVCRNVAKLPYSEQRIIELQVGHKHHEVSDHEIINYFKELLTDHLQAH